MDRGKFAKAIARGVGLGIIYYVIFYIIVLGLVTYYILPNFLTNIVSKYDISSEEVRGIVSSALDYNPFKPVVLAFFITIYAIISLVRTYIPYASLIEAGLSIVLLYYVLSTIGFGYVKVSLENPPTLVMVDISPLMKTMFIALSLFIVGGGVLRASREYREHRENWAEGQ